MDKDLIQKTITCYHYTNLEAYNSMSKKGIEGYITNFDDFSGLIPSKRFVNVNWSHKDLPNEAYEEVIEGLLEPEPSSWTKNKEFPTLWYYLMHDICKRKEIMLLSFQLNPKDKAYIVERGHIEKELYKKSKGLEKPTRETISTAAKKYFESRIPVFDYKGEYSVPQLAIWSPIEFKRLKIEWIKFTKRFWKKVLKNSPG
jgi:hypothetical protein